MQRLRKTTSVSASPSGRPRLPRRYASPRFRRVRALTAALGAASLMLGSALHADTFNWLASPADTLFENPLNWVNSGGMNGVPGVNDDAVNSTTNVINYLLNAGSNTINSFTNSGGGTLNLNLSDPAGQTFTINGDVSNLLYTDPVTHAQTASTMDITGSFASTVNFNFNGGTLTNAGIISVHDGGLLTSQADTIVNSGAFSAATNADVSIFQARGIDDSFTNTGTVSALSGSLFSLVNTTTTNSGATSLFSADGANSTLGISSLLMSNDGTIQATNGGTANINASLFINNNTVQADGTGASFAPTIVLSGSTLMNSPNAYIQAIGGNGATVSVDFGDIENKWVLTSAAANTTLNINANTGFTTLNNTFAVGAGYGGLTKDYTQTINNFAYLDGTGHPSNYLGYGAFRNGQVYVFGDVNNAGVAGSVFNNGDAAGATPGWVHAFSDLAELEHLHSH